MTGLEADIALIEGLMAFAGTKHSAVIAKRAGIDPGTLQKKLVGQDYNRLSQRTLEKLQAAYPTFPGWAKHFKQVIEGLAADLRDETQTASAIRDRSEDFSPAPADVVGMVEVAGIDLNFGLGAAFMDSEIVEHLVDTMLFPRDWLRSITRSPPNKLYWAQGVGDSMEPTINDGDVILIDRSAIGSTFGDLYWAIAYGQTGMVKRLRPMPDGSIKILSNNPAVPPEVAHDGELHVFGRVIAVVRRL